MKYDNQESLMGTLRKSFRTFYFFKTGYSIYLAVFIGAINFLTSSYFLAIEKAPFLKSIFPGFEIYVITAFAIGLPSIAFFGWIHYKRTGVFSAESAVWHQNDIFSYKWRPGFEKEVLGPAFLVIFRATLKRAQSQKLSEDDLASMEKIEKQLQHLLDGGHVGNPPKGAFV